VESAFAYLHYASILALTGLLAAEYVLCNEHLQPGHVRLLARIDLAYVAAAIAVLATGLMRLIWFAKGPSFYLGNPLFYLKIALFIAIGLVSIAPTLQFLRWNRALDDGRVRVLSGADIARVRRLIGLELLLLVLVPLTAVLMARGISSLS
jgi:putative membrane protein